MKQQNDRPAEQSFEQPDLDPDALARRVRRSLKFAQTAARSNHGHLDEARAKQDVCDVSERGDVKVETLLRILALIFLGIFAVVWLWIAQKVRHFDPTPAHPKLELEEGFVTAAGFLAASVGAGTAAVLGIEIKKLKDEGKTLGVSVTEGMLSPFILTGILGYAVVGVIVFFVWLANQAVSPDVIQAFSFGLLGWLAGAFAGVFRAATT